MESAIIGLLSFTAGVIVMAICKVKINESEAEDRGYDKGFDEGVLVTKSAMQYMDNRGWRH